MLSAVRSKRCSLFGLRDAHSVVYAKPMPIFVTQLGLEWIRYTEPDETSTGKSLVQPKPNPRAL
jgi:hypothetical protein